jgi:hypothetical protein
MIEQIKQALHKATHGAEWTNFDGREYTKVVYEYDRLTEDTCDIIAECQTVEMAQFIADLPESLRYLIGEVERLEKYVVRLQDVHEVEKARIRAEVEGLQKALEWYADEENYDLPEGEHYIATKLDRGYRARETLQSLKEDKPNGNSTTV